MVCLSHLSALWKGFCRRAVTTIAAAVVGGALLLGSSARVAAATTLRVAIGHQSACTDTYTGGVVVKELGLLERYLPSKGKYQGISYNIVWEDYTSGPPITNKMLSGKLDIGVMGDYPLLVNGARFQETRSLRSLLVSMTGYNYLGSGNSVVVPADSDIFSFEDLEGHRVSVPFGSAAHGMLLKALVDRGLSQRFFTLINEAPPLGATNIREGKIDAHADFCPWGELLEFSGAGRKVYDGSEARVPYLHGVVVRKDFAEQYPEVVVAFVKAIIAAGDWIQRDPKRAAEAMERWTGMPKEVMYLYFGPGGILTLDPTIKPKWVETLQYDATVLEQMGIIRSMDVKGWIDERFVRQAYRELGLDYERQRNQLVTQPSPLRGRDALTGEPVTDGRQAAEIWVKEPNEIRVYASLSSFARAWKELKGKGQAVNAGYVFDAESGRKLFAHRAFYVVTQQGARPDIRAFARRPDAETYAAQAGGRFFPTLDDVLEASGL